MCSSGGSGGATCANPFPFQFRLSPKTSRGRASSRERLGALGATDHLPAAPVKTTTVFGSGLTIDHVPHLNFRSRQRQSGNSPGSVFHQLHHSPRVELQPPFSSNTIHYATTTPQQWCRRAMPLDGDQSAPCSAYHLYSLSSHGLVSTNSMVPNFFSRLSTHSPSSQIFQSLLPTCGCP